MAAYMEFDLNDSQASSYSPSSSSSPSVGPLSLWSDQEDDKSKPCGDHQFEEQGNEEDHHHRVEDDHGEDDDQSSYKWMPSKMRILRKMMMSSNHRDSGPKFEDQKPVSLEAVDHDRANTIHKSSYKNTMDDTIRVCSDCNTTKTPLWRSGPSGPKSLCNACGIRQRKARRAMAANGTALPVAVPSLKIKLKHNKNMKRSRVDLPNNTQMNKRREVAPLNGAEEKLIRFEDFTSRILSKNYSGNYEKLFLPQDEKEAAILLMALSCGLVCS